MQNSTVNSNSSVRAAYKKRFGKFLSSTALAAAGMAMIVSGPARADNWGDHTYEAGNVTVDTSEANTTNLNQTTDFVKARGDGDINAGWTVNVAQPNSTSKYVLYDTENDPTFIRGNLNANGEIFIFDQNGVIFGENSVVNVGSIVASTGFITDADLLDGDGKYTILDAGTDGRIELNGQINVSEAGLAAFVAPTVQNAGIIRAKLGQVAFAAGDKVTLDLYGDNLVEIAVDDKLADALLENTGEIHAEGGIVTMTAQTAKEAVDNVINMEGVIDVSSVEQVGGKIVLKGGAEGLVNVAGTLDASGTSGGDISVTGQNVYVAGTALLNANAGENGDGGTAYIYGNDYAIFEGTLSARGGAVSGNGGYAEISAGESVGYYGLTDLSATNGEVGTLLIDPRHLTISDAGFSMDWEALWTLGAEGVININDQALANTLRNNNVNLWATETLGTASDIDVSEYEYEVLVSHGHWQSCGFFCIEWIPPVFANVSGITANNLTVAAPEVNLVHDITLGTGALNVADLGPGDSVLGFGLIQPPYDIIVDELNLDGRVYKRSSLLDPSFTTLADDSQINTTADLINVKSNSALIQQGVHFAEAGATVDVGAGTYKEFVTVDKAINLYGAQAGVDARGRAGTETIIETVNPSNDSDLKKSLITVTSDADGAVIDGFTLNAFVTRNGNLRGVVKVEAGADLVTVANNIFNTDVNPTSVQTNMPNEIWIEGDNATVEYNMVNRSAAAMAEADGNSAGNSAIRLGGIDNALVQYNTLDGGNIGISGGTGVITVKGNDISGTPSDGVWASNIGTTLLEVVDNVIDSGAHGLKFVGGITGEKQIVVTGNTIEADADGVHFAGDTSNVVSNGSSSISDEIYIGDNTISGGVNGVSFTGDVTHWQHDIKIEKNDIEGQSGDGILYEGNIAGGEIKILDNDEITGAQNGVRYVGDLQKAGPEKGRITIDGNLAIEGTAADGVHIEDTVAGDADVNIKNNDITAGEDGVEIVAVQGGRVEHNTIHDTGANGVYVNGSDKAKVLRNDIYNTGAHGVLVNPSKNVVVRGNKIGTLGTINGDGVLIVESDGAKVINNEITGIVSHANGYGSGVQVLDSDNVKVKKNDIYDTAWDGVRVDGGDNVTIHNNDVTDARRAGIYMNDVSNSEVTENTVDGTNEFRGIAVWNSDTLNVQGNTVSNTELDGIIAGTVTGLTITDNTVHSTGGDGIEVSDSAGVSISGNAVGYTDLAGTVSGGADNIGSEGIDVNNSPNALIEGNALVDLGKAGISVTGSSAVWVRDNTVEGAQTGIYGDNAVDIKVSDNTVTGTTQAGIHVKNSDGHGYNGGGKDVDIWANTVESEDGAIGILVENSAYATVGAHETNPFASGLSGGNIVSGGAQGIVVNDSDNAVVLYNTVSDVSAEGVKVDGGSDVEVRSNVVGNTGHDGIRVEDTSYALVRLNTVDVTGAAGISLQNATGTMVDDNDISNTGGSGIWANNVDDSSLTNNAITNTGVQNRPTRDGIHAKNTDGLTVTGNEIAGVAVNGIYAEDVYGLVAKTNDIEGTGANTGIKLVDSDNATIGGSDVADGNTVSDFADGIVLEKSDGASVHNNVISSILNYGIRLFGGSHEFNMQGNDITGGDTGISIEDAVSTVVALVKDNVLNGVNNGIAVSNSSLVQLIDNDITGNSTTGIDAYNSDGIVISGNDIEHFDDGIVVEKSDGAVVSGNNLVDLANIGIYVLNSHGTLVGGYNAGEVNTIDGARTGIEVRSSDDVQIVKNDIDNIMGGANEGDGVRIYSSKRVKADGNLIDNVGDEGIFAKGNIDGLQIVNNVINGTGVHVNNTGNGIELFQTKGAATVSGNDITNADYYGIWIKQPKKGSSVTVDDNTVNGTSMAGISVDGYGVSVSGNTVSNTGDDGIEISKSKNVVIEGNSVFLAGGDGIEVNDSNYADIRNNWVYRSKDDGIDIENSYEADVNGNRVHFARYNGIEVENSWNADIRGNHVGRVGRDGIYAYNVDFGDIRGNHVHDAGDDGIWVGRSAYVDINDNYVNDTGDEGIVVENSYSADVKGNHVRDAGNNGIYIWNSDHAEVHDNVIRNYDAAGIRVDYSDDVSVTMNDIYGFDFNDSLYELIFEGPEGEYGVLVNGSDNILIRDNIIGGQEDDGIYVENSDYAEIDKNLIVGTGHNGIYVSNGYQTDITDNIVAGTGFGSFFGDGDGIRVENAVYTNIDDNLIVGTVGNGIGVYGGAYVSITDNQIALTGEDGIHVEGDYYYYDGPGQYALMSEGPGDYYGYGDFVNIEGNQIVLTGGDGIEVDSRGYTRIVDNDVFAAGIGFYGLFYGEQEFIFDLDFEFNEGEDRGDNEYGSMFDTVGIYGQVGFEWGNGDGIKVTNVRGFDGEFPGDRGDGPGPRPSSIGPMVRDGGEGDLPFDMNGHDVIIQGNNVAWTGGHGIDVIDTGSVAIDSNNVTRTGIDATVWNVDLEIPTYILEATADFVMDAIDYFEDADMDELGDDIRFGAGMVKRTLNDVNIAEGLQWLIPTPDMVAQSSHDGIHVRNAENVEITDNNVQRTGRDGIHVAYGSEAYITDNYVRFSGRDGVHSDTIGHVEIIDNEIYDSGDDGIDSSETYLVGTLIISDNFIGNSGDNGIEVSDSEATVLVDNIIVGSGNNGLYMEGWNNGYVGLSGNDFINNQTGARFESGVIDFVTGQPNVFVGGVDGMTFDLAGNPDPRALSIYGNSLGETIFSGQTRYYVQLLDRALFQPDEPTVINALNVSFDGFVPAYSPFGPGILTQAQFDALEAKVYHFLDDNDLGLIFFGRVPFVNQEDIFRGVDPFAAIASAPRVTVLGLPNLAGPELLLNAIAPAAGGEEDEEQGTSPEDLAAIEPAAGGAEVACWGDAIASANAGQSVNFSFGSSQAEILAAQAQCQNNL